MSYLSTGHQIYPSRYECHLMLDSGKEVFLRPILPTDSFMLLDLFQKLSSESLYLRFLRPLARLPEDLLFRLTHIDYNDSFALVALIVEGGRESIIGVARYSYDPATYIADAAVVVRDDWQRLGLGKSLLVKIYDIGCEHGICRFVSVIAPTNGVIKQILRKLGYKVKYSYPSGATQVEVIVQKMQ